jgi:hypothetical protein
MIMPRIAPIQPHTTAQGILRIRNDAQLRRIKNMAKTTPWVAAAPLFLVAVLINVLWGGRNGGDEIWFLPGVAVGLILLYQLQRLTWMGDCQPEKPLTVVPAIVLGGVFALLGALWQDQFLMALDLLLRIMVIGKLSADWQPIMAWIGFFQAAIIFTWLGLRISRYQYFMIVLGFYLVAFLVLAICWPLGRLIAYYPFYSDSDALAMVGVYACIALVGLVLWGIAPVMYLRLHRALLRRKPVGDENWEEA